MTASAKGAVRLISCLVVAGRVSNFETRASPSLFAPQKRIARAMNRIRA
jgi:hypothetical protein